MWAQSVRSCPTSQQQTSRPPQVWSMIAAGAVKLHGALTGSIGEQMLFAHADLLKQAGLAWHHMVTIFWVQLISLHAAAFMLHVSPAPKPPLQRAGCELSRCVQPQSCSQRTDFQSSGIQRCGMGSTLCRQATPSCQTSRSHCCMQQLQLSSAKVNTGTSSKSPGTSMRHEL